MIHRITVPPDAHSLAGFRRWVLSGSFPERGKVSLINGVVWIDMSPERAESHNNPKKAVCRVLDNLVEEEDLGKFYIDGMWLTNDDANLSTEPDALFATWEAFESGRLQLIISDEEEYDGIELRGAPDWVLEVASPTSVQKDTQLMPARYHQAGIREFWLIDARSETLRFDVYEYQSEGYRQVEADAQGWLTSQVFGRKFRMSRQRDRLGGWKHRLEMADT